MSNDEVMLTTAYCRQTDSLEPAEVAHRHADDWFYCTEEICLIEVRPIHGVKNYFFRALKGALHHPECCYFKEPKDDEGNGDPKPKPTPDPVPLIPTVLGPHHRKRQLRKPTREELLLLVKAASQRPPAIHGTLDEVVSAWEKMSHQERMIAPLMIGENHLTYRDAFVFLAWAGDDFESIAWDTRIVFGGCKFESGDVNGFFFLTSLKKFIHQNIKKPLHLTIGRGPLPASLTEITPGTEGTIFWHGSAPDPGHNPRLLKFHRPDDERYKGFVFRPHVYGG
ncbi:hypothetical protein [Magnetospirillum sp. 15-1]|uniref:hypothetical protein n=1 Tax=Magnetospirillum sp. 15-1 TaxID=1979370 RepID=UPI000BBBA3E4|nr:hypothetical protein [Magnetospirillum sp. 15-1]